MTNQLQGVRMASRDALRHLDPRGTGDTGFGQNGRGCASRIVLERYRCPVIGHGVRAAHPVPETQRTGPGGSCECLADAAITIGRRGPAHLSRVSARMRRAADRGRPGCGPAGEAPRLEAAVGNATTAR